MNARDVALDVLRQVETRKAFANTVLRHAITKAQLQPHDAGLATELVYGVLRWRGVLDQRLAHVSGRKHKDIDRRLIDILRVGAYQIDFLDRVPDHAVVDSAVRQAKRRKAHPGFVNAVLRKYARLAPLERRPPPLPADAPAQQKMRSETGLPNELTQVLLDALGPSDALSFARASMMPAPLTLRVNELRATASELLAEIPGSTPGAIDGAIQLPSGVRTLPSDLAAVEEGRATPQDEASMRVVELLAPQPGERVLDVCAAPGGKTTHMAERMRDSGEVLAYDRLPRRLAQVDASAQRLGLSIVRTLEVLPEVGELFDRVLVDAPCSGLGTLRRHPELRWKFRREDLSELRKTQMDVLHEGAARVRPGGVLVYSICTVTREESSVVEGLAGFRREESFRTGPHEPHAPDGFFAARLIRE